MWVIQAYQGFLVDATRRVLCMTGFPVGIVLTVKRQSVTGRGYLTITCPVTHGTETLCKGSKKALTY